MDGADGVTDGAELASAFDRAEPGTIGVEEELMLLDPGSHELTPRAPEILEMLDGDPRFKLELPACQLESVTAPARSVKQIGRDLAAGRRDLALAVGDRVRLAAAGVHPCSPPAGEINDAPRYRAVAEQLGEIVMRRQLVFALQVHVAPGSSARALGTYNALRSYLPEIAALAANAPFFAGEDTGLASVRPKICELLPRQGVPPALASWDELAAALAWGQAADLVPNRGNWWWELRLHPGFGTLELRVPDAQTTVADATAIAALAHCLVSRLSERAEAGESLPVHPSWRIAENRWLAARDGIEAVLADLDTGRRMTARERLGGLVDELEATAAVLGCSAELEQVRGLIDRNGALQQREIAAAAGIGEVPRWLADRFLEGCDAEEG